MTYKTLEKTPKSPATFLARARPSATWLLRIGVAMAACAAAAITTSVTSGCETCHAVACGSPFRLVIDANETSLPLGAYALDVTTESGQVALQCTFTGDRTTSSCASSEHGDDEGLAARADVVYAEDGTPEELLLELARHDGPDVEGPREVHVVVEVDGDVRADTRYEPVYERDEIAGPGCGWCETAPTETLTLSAEAT